MKYELNEEESAALAKFRRKHRRKCSGSTKVVITEVGIGRKYECLCTICKKLKDISDYGSW